MPIFLAEKYKVRLATTKADVIGCQQLRYLTFIEQRGLDRGAQMSRLDRDEFDAICGHMMVEETRTGKLVCCFRMLHLNNGSEIVRSYSAKYYELSKLAAYPGQMVEMGRFCIHPAYRNPAILRVAWAAMSRFVDQEGVELLFGCSSFHGVDAEAYMDAFALLKEKHLAPKRWLPRVKAPNVFRFARLLKLMRPDVKQALRLMPPLLRTYLVMGGWVSDHAVIDNDLNTLHVFTGVEIKRMSPTRARMLRRAGV
ncbi:MAG TPA: GNAT family N-acyltransferase [Thermohalobaculum sp.]|nr:GNAT family N-acyltransferase [Thermohalobaculum sp.]